MIQQKDKWWWFKLNGCLRWFLTNYSPFTVYIVNEYPKSGGTWISLMLSELLKIPFPQNRLPIFSTQILHGHYKNIRIHSKNKIIIVWRDGRDVLISQYYHYLFPKKDAHNHYLVNKVREHLKFKNYEDIKTNLPVFIEYVYSQKAFPRFSWSEFVDCWYNNENVFHVKYEDMRKQPVIELKRIAEWLGYSNIPESDIKKVVEMFSFERMSGRKPGMENKHSFLRKGIVGDWKNYFTKTSARIFNSYAGKQLILLGYEKDDSWINMLSDL